MALLLLPVEVLTQVIGETIADDFENFALTCRTVYRAAASFLEKHNRLRRRYRHFEYDEDSCSSSLQLLSQIADEPSIARYIVSAGFKADAVPDDDSINNALVDHIKSSSNFLSLFEGSPYLQSADVNPTCVRDYLLSQYAPRSRHSALATPFLLTLLPNITELSLPQDWEDEYVLDRPDEIPWHRPSLLDDIVRRANDPRDLSAGLSRLTSILPSTAWGYEFRWSLATFSPFLSIKTVRNFYAGGCRAIDEDYAGAEFPDPSYESFGVGLEVVELVGACVDGGELWKFVSRLPQLRSLKLSYETKGDGCGHDMDATAIMAAIEEGVGGTLEDLSFSVYSCIGEIENGVKSMKKFTRLRELELDMQVLVSFAYHNFSGNLGDVPNDNHHEVPRLGDLLPPTIETLCLMVEDIHHSSHDLGFLFSEAATEKDYKLPNLKEIVILNRNEGTPDYDLDESEMLAHNESDMANSSTGEAPGKFSAGNAEEVSADSSDISSNTQSKMNFSKEPPNGSPIPQWRVDLAALGSSVNVRFVKVAGDFVPSFMEGFCERYGVVSGY